MPSVAFFETRSENAVSASLGHLEFFEVPLYRLRTEMATPGSACGHGLLPLAAL